NGTLCKEGYPGVYREVIGGLFERVPGHPDIGCDFSPILCRCWILEKTSEKMCTLPTEQRDKCVLEKNVDTPDEARLFCAKCEYYKDINIVPVPAHCSKCR